MNLLHLTLLLVSTLLFYYALKLISSFRKYLLMGVVLAALLACYLFYSSLYLVAYYFTGVGIDNAVLFHLQSGLSGAGFREYKSLLVSIVLLLCVGMGIGCYFLFKRRKLIKPATKLDFCLVAGFLILSVIVHPATHDLFQLSRVDLGENFWKYYEKPQITNSVENPKNLVWIYLESFERTYLDQNLFPGVIKELKKIEEQNLTFTNIGGFPGTGWTIAGMVASQCGIPLFTLSHGNSMGGMDAFLPNATCFGDLLSRKGYHLEYLGGSSLNFAGKGNFYKSHGFETVSGLEELRPNLSDPSYISGWGLYDDTLLNIAYDRFVELSEKNNPFGMVLLTLDTHGSGNHLSRDCQDNSNDSGKSELSEALSCTDKLISSFIRRIQNSAFNKDTIIVISSDHLTMKPGKVLQRGTRRNLFIIVNPTLKSETTIENKGTTLDVGVTVLNAMGFNSRLGLGRNLLEGDPTIKDMLNLSDQILNGWKKDMKTFWSFPRISEKITVDGKGRAIVLIDDREFKAPVLIKYDSRLRTNMWFQRDGDSVHKSLVDHLIEFNADSPFLLVNSCRNLKENWPELEPRGLCFVSGKLGSSKIVRERVINRKVFTKEELLDVYHLPSSESVYQQNIHKLSYQN